MIFGDALEPDGGKRELRGVGGWLAFLCVWLVFFTPVIAGLEFADTALSPDLPPLETAIGMGFVLAVVVFALIAGIALIRAWPYAVGIAKAYFFVSFTFGLLVGASAFLPEATIEDALLGARETAVSVAWLVYLYRSERVRNTYAKLGAEAEAPR